MKLPKRPRGNPGKRTGINERYEAGLRAFANELQELNSRLDFKVSSRGWCYILENELGLSKADFDKTQKLIILCRKEALLPLDFVAEEEARAFSCLEYLNDEDPEEWAESVLYELNQAHNHYDPLSFWEDKDCYIQMLVEKVDLMALFEPICRQYHIPIANAKGWSSLSQRGELIARFRHYEGRKLVLLYCGDHDPSGLQISDKIIKHIQELHKATGWLPRRNFKIDRFGLNYDFIEEQGLSWIDGLKTSSGLDLGDSDHKFHNANFVQQYINRFGERKVEANALVVRPEAGRELCLRAINKYVPASAIEDFENALEELRQEAREELARLLSEVYG